MNKQFYTAKARSAWDEAAHIHWRKTNSYIEDFKQGKKSFLTLTHLKELYRIGLEDVVIGYLNCNNGRELISLMREGPKQGIGFDISSEFIKQANLFKDAAQVNCRFVASDIYEMSDEFNGMFDIVLVTSGALCFMPDLAAYFSVAKRILKSGGQLNIYDCHPIVDMFDLDRDRNGGKLEFVRSYFDKEPMRHTSGLDYVGGSTYEAEEIFYFHHKLSDIFQTLLAQGFRIEYFDETGEDPSQAYPSVEASTVKPPLSFLLTVRAP